MPSSWRVLWEPWGVTTNYPADCVHRRTGGRTDVEKRWIATHSGNSHVRHPWQRCRDWFTIKFDHSWRPRSPHRQRRYVRFRAISSLSLIASGQRTKDRVIAGQKKRAIDISSIAEMSDRLATTIVGAPYLQIARVVIYCTRDRVAFRKSEIGTRLVWCCTVIIQFLFRFSPEKTHDNVIILSPWWTTRPLP